VTQSRTVPVEFSAPTATHTHVTVLQIRSTHKTKLQLQSNVLAAFSAISIVIHETLPMNTDSATRILLIHYWWTQRSSWQLGIWAGIHL